jgi:alkylated DNA repair dioxygenase AlkB
VTAASFANTSVCALPATLPEAKLKLFHCFFDPTESDHFFQTLLAQTQWEQRYLTVFGKTYPEPRLTAWHGDAGKGYSYSGITLEPLPWTPTLLQIKARVDSAAQTVFNSVLLNLYRHGRDSNGWHQDNEPELGHNPVIASVSFGAARRFQLRHKFRRELPKVEFELPHGSLLLMAGPTQHYWQHQIPKTAKPVEVRINLTFRVIL